MLPAIEPTSTMAPPSVMCFTACCTVNTMARTLRPNVRSKCSALVSSRLAGSATPEEFTRISRRPARACTVSNRRATSSALVRSPAIASMRPPVSVTASASSASRRPVMKTWAPSCTKRRAMARPIPLPPPVTSATFPSSFIMAAPE